jgi:hypothetical protein
VFDASLSSAGSIRASLCGLMVQVQQVQRAGLERRRHPAENDPVAHTHASTDRPLDHAQGFWLWPHSL